MFNFEGLGFGVVQQAAKNSTGMIIDLVVALIRAGAPVDVVLAEFIGAGLGITFFWNMFCIKVVWNLCSRWASIGSTLILDCLVSLIIFLIYLGLMAACSSIVNVLFAVSNTSAIAVGLATIVIALLAYRPRGGGKGLPFSESQ